MKLSNLIISALMLGAISGCVAVPRDGPSNAKVISDAEVVVTADEEIFVYDVFDITSNLVDTVTNYHSTVFNRNFGFGKASSAAVIGIGDQLTITIFEASTEGLFSTTDNKSTTIQVVVQPNGRASIPYVGSVNFAGKSLDSARLSLLSALKGKAVEPDILVSLTANASRQVTVTGEVNASKQVEIGLAGSQLLQVIAEAGGPKRSPYDTKVTVARGNKRATTRMTNVIEHPSENVFLNPKDQVVLEYDPSRFLVLGASGDQGRIEFNAPKVSMIEALALAGGKNSAKADPKGVFVFRYENIETIKDLMGEAAYQERLALGHWNSDKHVFPIVYRLDMTKPSSYLIGQNFQIRSGDLLYLSEHPSTEYEKFLGLLGLTIVAADRITSL